MATLIIPTQTTALFWSHSTVLDGVSYVLDFRYNSRESAYYLRILSADGTITYAQGIKLVSNYALLGFNGLGTTPPGEMMALSMSTSDDSPARLGELGSGQRVTLVYIPEADLFAQPPPAESVTSKRNPEGG